MIQSALIVGRTVPEALESSYARALQHLNWTVRFWEPKAALYRASRGGRIGNTFATYVKVEPWLRKANLELLRLAHEIQPDLILVVYPWFVHSGTLAQIRVRVPKARLYCLYPDSPHNLDSDHIHCLPFFDRVLTSSPAWIPAFQKLGAVNARYLPFAADTSLHQPASKVAGFVSDVAFIGTWRPEREIFLRQLSGFDLRVWGSRYWKTRTHPASPLRSSWGGRSVHGYEFAQVCASSSILLNIMDPATWPGPNMRCFEVPACRGFALVTRSPAVLEIFEEGRTVECYDTWEEASDKIRYYLAHPQERQRIAGAAYEHVIHGGHTYIDRAHQLTNWMLEDGLT